MCFAKSLELPFLGRWLCRSHKHFLGLSGPSCPTPTGLLLWTWKKSSEAQESPRISTETWCLGADQPLLVSGEQIQCCRANRAAGLVPWELTTDATPNCPCVPRPVIAHCFHPSSTSRVHQGRDNLSGATFRTLVNVGDNADGNSASPSSFLPVFFMAKRAVIYFLRSDRL